MPWVKDVLPGRSDPLVAAVRLVIWLALLVAVALAGWHVISMHRERVRGIPRGFPAPVDEAAGPPLGVNVALDRYTEDQVASALSLADEGGFVWVRQSFYLSRVMGEGPGDAADWSGVDRVMDALGEHPNLRMVAVLEDDPPAPPADHEEFAAFARAFAERYGDRVDDYQIWDEPNLEAHWGGPVSPTGYADLLSRAARAIRRADPGARVLLAGLAPTTEAGPRNMSEVRYLERLYEAGAAPFFDIVAAKPYGFDTGPYDRRVDASVLNASRVLLLRELMVERGDEGKAIWATHWGWNALPEGWEGRPSIWGQTDEATRAERSVAMLERSRSEWPWMGAMIIETLQPEPLPATSSSEGMENPRWGFSLVASDGAPRPTYRALSDWVQDVPAVAPVGGYPARNRWATYEGSWRAGPVGAGVGHSPGSASDEGQAVFRFSGTRVAMTVRRGSRRAFLTVTVDGEPANALPRDERGRAYVVLYDEQSSVATVPLATNLEPGEHTVTVVAAGGEGQWPLVDWRVGAEPVRDGLAWKLAGLTAAAAVLATLILRQVRRLRWSSVVAAFFRLPSWGQAGLIIGLTGVLWGTAGLSWGRFTAPTIPSLACFALSLLMLPALIFLFALRLDLGLTLVALTAPFYLVPETMVYRALSLPEVLIVLCAAGYVAARAASRRSVNEAWISGPFGGDPIRPLTNSFKISDAAVLLLVLAALASGAAADDRIAALFELRSVFLLPALYYGFLRLAPLNRRAWRHVLGGLLLGGVGVAVVGLAQYALRLNLVAAEGGLLRLQSVYHSPNSVGLLLGRVWPFLVVGVWSKGDRSRRGLAIVALLVVTLALGLSFSRGALLLALPVSILAMGWWAGGRCRWVSLALVGLGALTLVPLLTVPRFAALLDLGRGTTFFRLQLWQSSLQMIREHPLLGVGPGNFLEAYRTRYVLPSAWEQFNLEHAHNILLDHWTRLGVLGVAAGLALQAAFWRALSRRKRRDPLVLGLVGSMAALLGHGLVDNAVFFPDLAIAFFLTLAAAADGWRASD